MVGAFTHQANGKFIFYAWGRKFVYRTERKFLDDSAMQEQIQAKGEIIRAKCPILNNIYSRIDRATASEKNQTDLRNYEGAE